MSRLGQSLHSVLQQQTSRSLSIQGEPEEEGDPPQGEVKAIPSSLFPQPSHLSLQDTVRCQPGCLLFLFELKIRQVVSISDSPLITTHPASATPRKRDRPSRRKDLREAPGRLGAAPGVFPGIMFLLSALMVGICASRFGEGWGAWGIAHSAPLGRLFGLRSLPTLEKRAQHASRGR